MRSARTASGSSRLPASARSRALSPRASSRTSSPAYRCDLRAPARHAEGIPLRDTHRAMPEKSTTPDLVELTRELGEARGVELTMRFYGPSAVYDMSRVGLGTFEGRPAIRRFLGDWLSSYEDTEDDLQEITDLGNGIVFAL